MLHELFSCVVDVDFETEFPWIELAEAYFGFLSSPDIFCAVLILLLMLFSM